MKARKRTTNDQFEEESHQRKQRWKDSEELRKESDKREISDVKEDLIEETSATMKMSLTLKCREF